MKNYKKSVMGPVISVFVLVLVISILAGLTFLFVSQLKVNASNTSTRTAGTASYEVVSSANLIAGYNVAGLSDTDAKSFTLTGVMNATDNSSLLVGNATLTSAGVLTNATVLDDFADGFAVNYTYSYIGADDDGAYLSINSTEAAGATIVGYLPLIFLAIIFGAILTLVLKIILPYINLGRDMGGF